MQRLLLVLTGLLFAGLTFAGPLSDTRPAAVAGSWYPAESKALKDYLDDFLQSKQPQAERSPIRALISPHAGYAYSGKVAAMGFSQLRGQSFNRVIVLGPAHHVGFHGLSIADVTQYQTPLGLIPLDRKAVAQLRASDLVTNEPSAHAQEHSIEMQLPFLQRVLEPDWKLVPILVGQLHPGDYLKAASLLRPLLNEQTLVVVSSDFTHYGPRYGYVPFPPDRDVAAHLKALDDGALDLILARNPQGFLDYRSRTGATICGYAPIAILLQLFSDRDDIKGELIGYDTSGRMTDDYQNSVSYLSIAFRALGPNDTKPGSATISSKLSPRDMQLLHRLAAAAVEVAARAGNDAARQRLGDMLGSIPEHLKTPSGAFVTLRRAHRLRGCVGYIQPRKPLYEAVASNGINAARNDWRFPPLQPQELHDLEIEISVLTPPKTIASYEEFRVGEEGIILEKDGHSAVFLPEVATEYGWDREHTLSRLAHKAGLPEDAWKQGATFKTFRTQTYTAPYAEAR